MKKGKVIRDPIHGYIRVDDFAIDIVDTVEMQRLRRIRQLGFSYLVYPGANHTRFEHSLGVFHLADTLTTHLGMSKDETRELLAAALIHDIGHGPYSHVTEPLLRKYTGKSHEDIDDILLGRISTADADDSDSHGSEGVNGESGDGGDARRGRHERVKAVSERKRIAEVLEEHDLNVRKVISFVKGERKSGGCASILKGEIDVDKMDYLVRDAYYTGVAYGVIDNMRLIHGVTLYNGEIVLTKKGIIPAEYLIFSRFLMYPTVYNHHTTRIAQLMFLRAMDAYIEECVEDATHFVRDVLRRMDDCEANVLLRRAGGFPSEMMRRIDDRALFKRAFYRPIGDVREELLEELANSKESEVERKIREIENDIARRAKIEDARLVILDVPRRERTGESAVKVLLEEGGSQEGRSQEGGSGHRIEKSESASVGDSGDVSGDSKDTGDAEGERLKRLRDVSLLVRMVERALNESYNVGVYTISEYRDAVRIAAEAILC